MTLASSEPCGSCLCCQAGKRCARILLLDPKDRSVLTRLEALGFGQSDGTLQWSKPSPSARSRAEKPEPTVELECERCGDLFAVAAYIVETFKARGFTPRRCEACRHAGRERADLA